MDIENIENISGSVKEALKNNGDDTLTENANKREKYPNVIFF